VDMYKHFRENYCLHNQDACGFCGVVVLFLIY